MEKIPDRRNAKKYYQSFIRKKNTTSIKQSEIITRQPKAFETSKIVDIKSVIREHPNTSHNLSNTEKVGSNIYSDTKKVKIFQTKKCKNNEMKQAFKGFASSYNVEIVNSFNPELLLKNTESVIKSKVIDFLSKWRGFKSMTTLVLVLKKIESEDKTKYDIFYSSSKIELIINENDIDDVFQSIYLQLHQIYKDL